MKQCNLKNKLETRKLFHLTLGSTVHSTCFPRTTSKHDFWQPWILSALMMSSPIKKSYAFLLADRVVWFVCGAWCRDFRCLFRQNDTEALSTFRVLGMREFLISMQLKDQQIQFRIAFWTCWPGLPKRKATTFPTTQTQKRQKPPAQQ